MTVMLLKRLQGLFPAPTPLPAQISMKISVQPYLPQNSMGYRVLSKAKDLNTPLTVKLFYNSNGTNALKGIIEQPPVPAAAPAAKKAAARDIGERNDDPVRRVSLTEADLGGVVPGARRISTTGQRSHCQPAAARRGRTGRKFVAGRFERGLERQDGREQPGNPGLKRDPQPRSGSDPSVTTASVHRRAFFTSDRRCAYDGDAPQVALYPVSPAPSQSRQRARGRRVLALRPCEIGHRRLISAPRQLAAPPARPAAKR